jgi:ADP-ribose pyrophosphatase YjhB (NUDIX family)
MIRPIAICVFRRGDMIFVGDGYDTVKREVFYRPLGGAIKFGEHSRDAVVREIREEIGQEITDLCYLGTLENIFTCDGQPGHEIVQVYRADFADSTMYEQASMTGTEGGGLVFEALWKAVTDFEREEAPLYPDGLLQLLAQTQA